MWWGWGVVPGSRDIQKALGEHSDPFWLIVCFPGNGFMWHEPPDPVQIPSIKCGMKSLQAGLMAILFWTIQTCVIFTNPAIKTSPSDTNIFTWDVHGAYYPIFGSMKHGTSKRITNLNRGKTKPDIFMQSFPVTKLCHILWKSSVSE